ncbi:hypothetical protein SPBR_02734 [Sporothrix brasiliensis 5110]|uniref:Uncharacterized protein n=1 Tax=Sporothrix brasiliensis 5110 TaxID=1398154 RepID=A0A0C2J212_9PEZI|nr:uncharacterized protein SPBR_02734 [Sporothrix brasiliensis 5110]KIH93055.1 hypothetical protein SPBR_02734 [Sporothrix brasiliensis 5110]
MAPGTVRTIPPWVIQRPPESLHPQHNHAPSDPRHKRSGAARDHIDENNDRERNDDNPVMSGAAAGGNRAVDGAAHTADTAGKAITGKEENHDRGIGHRLSHLFQSKEGRKWDHLRSSEPVIVPQFHVVNGPINYGQSEDADEPYIDNMRQPRVERIHSDGTIQVAREELAADVIAAEAASLTPPTAAAATLRPASTAATPSASASGASPHAIPTPQKQSSTTRTRHAWWYNPETQWRSFIESSRYPHSPNEKSEVIGDEEMARLNPDFGYNVHLPPKVGDGDGHFHHNNHRSKYSDKAFYVRIWQTLLHHPLGPLACRLVVLSTSLVALIIAITIFKRERLGRLFGEGDRTSTDFNSVWLANMQQERNQIIVAIVVDVVAIPYIGYITFDDYTGKPLGLRPPQARIRLILTDLFFIIFKSASTALGFEAMVFFNTASSQGLLRALGAFELIGLVSWALTLTINIFREIERLGG